MTRNCLTCQGFKDESVSVLEKKKIDAAPTLKTVLGVMGLFSKQIHG